MRVLCWIRHEGGYIRVYGVGELRGVDVEEEDAVAFLKEEAREATADAARRTRDENVSCGRGGGGTHERSSWDSYVACFRAPLSRTGTRQGSPASLDTRV